MGDIASKYLGQELEQQTDLSELIVKSSSFQKLNLSLKKNNKCRNRYKRCYVKWRDNRRSNITNIQQLIIGLESTKHKCNITSLSSSVGGVVGGLLTGVGLITMPLSFGATAPLFISGATVLGAASVTGIGGAAADFIISNQKCKDAQAIINRDVELTTELQLLEQEYAKTTQEIITVALHDLKTNYPEDYNKLSDVLSAGISVGGVIGAGSNICTVGRLARMLYLAEVGKLTLTSTKLIDQINPIPFMNVGAKVDDALGAGSQAGVIATRGARIGMVAAGALCVVGLAIDVTTVVYNSRQIHMYRRSKWVGDSANETKYNTGSQENSKRGSKLGSKLKDGLFGKLKQKVTHPFTKNYISGNAEQLKKYVEKLETELFTMENNISIKKLVVQCECRECTPIGGGTVHCCHENPLYWNSIHSVNADQPIITHNTPSLCVTQHPLFALIYLNVNNLQKHIPKLKEQQTSGKFKSYSRQQRLSAYTLFTQNSSQLGRRLQIPHCVRRAVVHAFQDVSSDIWMDGDELGTKLLWKERGQSIFYDDDDVRQTKQAYSVRYSRNDEIIIK